MTITMDDALNQLLFFQNHDHPSYQVKS